MSQVKMGCSMGKHWDGILGAFLFLCVEKIKEIDFSLDDVYAFEAYLQAKHPENHNVRAKTRSGQQLQFLRDKGVIEFLGRGRYWMKQMGT